MVNVHTEKKIKGNWTGEGKPYRLSPNPKISYIEFYFSRGDSLMKISLSGSGINRELETSVLP